MSSKDRGGLSVREWEEKYGVEWVDTTFDWDDDAEDDAYGTAEEDLTPYYETQISDTLEDLTATIENATTNYKRTMRSNRATMAKAGKAMGTYREGVDEETTSDYETSKENYITAAERSVGSEAISGAGYNTQYDNRTGTINEAYDAAVEERVNQYRSEAESEFYSNLGSDYGKTI